MNFVCLIYGEVGTGKTGMISTFPRPRVLDFDRRAKTLLCRLKPAYDWEKNVHTFLDHKNAKGVILADGHFAFDDATVIMDGWWKDKEWDTLVFDTGTALADLANAKAVVLNGKNGVSKTHAEALRDGVVLSKIQDYGSERSLMEQFIQHAVDKCNENGKNFVFFCHEKQETNDAGNTTGYRPLLTGRGGVAIPAMFGEVYNLRLTGTGPGVKRFLQTERDGMRLCRSDLGVTNNVEATYQAIVASIPKGA